MHELTEVTVRALTSPARYFGITITSSFGMASRKA